MKKTITTLFLCVVYFTSRAPTVTLGWSAEADTSVVGYNLYQGVMSRLYTNMIKASSSRTVTNYQVLNLVPGVKYYFALTSFNQAGLQSDYSIELAYVAGSMPPTITAQPVSAVNNANGTQSFTVVATGTSLTYLWLKNNVVLSNGSNISGVTASTLTISSLTGNDNGSYSVIVTSPGGSVVSAPATLAVIPVAPIGLIVSSP